MKRTTTIVSLVALAGLAAGALLVAAGPLNPPAGPVASSYKTLNEVEPRIAINQTNTPGDATHLFRITQPGSYYLTDNITIPVGKSGIGIQTNFATIDLNGFTITGNASSGSGITSDNFTYSDCAVLNGSVSSCGGDGIDLSSVWASTVSNVKIWYGSGRGIVVSLGAVVTNCTAQRTSQAGFASGGSCSFVNCTSEYCQTGFKVDSSSDVLEGCVANNNSGDGFVTNNATLTHCVSDNNGGSGYNSNFGDRFTNCRAGYNVGNGFLAVNSAVVDGCQSLYNHQVGYTVGNASTIRGSVAGSNFVQGIKVGDHGTVIGNNVRFNGSGLSFAGIWATGANSVIEGNTSCGNGYGVYVSGTANVVVKNTCNNSSVANYYIVAGNRVGTITSGTTNAALISGNSGGGLGATDPNANIGY